MLAEKGAKTFRFYGRVLKESVARFISFTLLVVISFRI